MPFQAHSAIGSWGDQVSHAGVWEVQSLGLVNGTQTILDVNLPLRGNLKAVGEDRGARSLDYVFLGHQLFLLKLLKDQGVQGDDSRG